MTLPKTQPVTTARVVLSLHNSEQSVEINGVDISRCVRTVTVSGGAGTVPQLTLTLNVEHKITTDCSGVEMYLSPATAALLAQLGWKSPEE